VTVPDTLPGDPAATTIPGETTTTTAPPDDPAANGDAPSETVPAVDYTIPPRPTTPLAGSSGFYSRQGDFASYPGRVVRVTDRTARAHSQQARAALDAAVANRDALVAHQVELRARVAQLATVERTAVEQLERARADLDERAADAFIRGGLGPATALLSSDDAQEYSSRMEIMQVVLEADQRAIRAFTEARAQVDDDQAQTARDLADVSRQIGEAEQAVASAEQQLQFADRELAITLAGGNLVIHGFTFPVAGPFSYVDSFGAPRMTGTAQQHWHEGTDIFAASGTELVACERGVITRMGTNSLGGITVWLKGESGTSYYYAHLIGYAPGVNEGLVVEAGTVLGYVGNTGNAATTPSHVHFEVHPGGGPAVNPYPILTVAQEQPQPEPIRL
jgi:murein DD-endopeptidase MepM/ murein hydrolase activator NlpD